MARSTLDDPSGISAVDASGMLGAMAGLGRQLSEGFRTARATSGLPAAEGLDAVVVCGMGGSGVAGDVLRSLYAGALPVPVVVAKGYSLPEFCGSNTLFLAVSYSGNTEETIAAYADAAARSCRVVAVCAGGELAALAEADDVPRVPVPAGALAPRAAVGYLSAAPIGILDAMGLVPPAQEAVARTARSLDALAERLGPRRPTGDNPAKDLAAWLDGRTPVIWGSDGLAEAPAFRWKTQLNENAKVPAFHALLPELDHNEIEGWAPGTGETFAVVVLRHRGEHPKIAARVEATVQAVSASGLEARQAWAEGSERFEAFEALFSLVMLGDFVSAYLAIWRGVDPTPIPVLTGLKERLRER